MGYLECIADLLGERAKKWGGCQCPMCAPVYDAKMAAANDIDVIPALPTTDANGRKELCGGGMSGLPCHPW